MKQSPKRDRADVLVNLEKIGYLYKAPQAEASQQSSMEGIQTRAELC